MDAIRRSVDLCMARAPGGVTQLQARHPAAGRSPERLAACCRADGLALVVVGPTSCPALSSRGALMTKALAEHEEPGPKDPNAAAFGTRDAGRPAHNRGGARYEPPAFRHPAPA